MKSDNLASGLRGNCASLHMVLFASASMLLGGCGGNSSPTPASSSSVNRPTPPPARQVAHLDDAAFSEWHSYGNLWQKGSVTKLKLIWRSVQEQDLSASTTAELSMKFGEVEGKLLSLLSDARIWLWGSIRKECK